MPLKLGCDLSRLDLERPTGMAVYARFVLDLLLSTGQVELADPRESEAILSLDGRFRPGRGQVTVTAVYDLGHFLERRGYSALTWLRQNWRVASAARRSDFVLAPSSAVRYGLERYLRVAPGRVTVLEPLPRPEFRRSTPQEARALRQEMGLPERYFLFVGARSRRKNLPLLERAWRLVSPRLGRDVGLVLGGPGAQGVAGATDLGYVALDRLPVLLSGGIAWLDPSFYEGCSVGALEAMACGTPPIVSGAGALPRTVDRAGLILDPHDPQQWADAMVALAEKETVRASLSAAGRKTVAERRAHPPDPTELLSRLSGRT